MAWRVRFLPQFLNLGLQARIRALRLGFGPGGLNLGLDTGIWALRLEFGPRDWDLRGIIEEEKEEGKMFPMCMKV